MDGYFERELGKIRKCGIFISHNYYKFTNHYNLEDECLMKSYEPLLLLGCHGQVGNFPICPQEAENGLVLYLKVGYGTNSVRGNLQNSYNCRKCVKYKAMNLCYTLVFFLVKAHLFKLQEMKCRLAGMARLNCVVFYLYLYNSWSISHG